MNKTTVGVVAAISGVIAGSVTTAGYIVLRLIKDEDFNEALVVATSSKIERWIYKNSPRTTIHYTPSQG